MFRTLSILLFKRTYRLLTLSFLSLFVGGLVFGVVVSFTGSVNQYVQKEGKSLVGGDIILSSPYPINKEVPVFEKLKSAGVLSSDTRSFQGVFSSNGSSTTAAQIRAVDRSFPLYGEVVLARDQVFVKEPGSLYAEKSFLSRLNVSIGDTVSFAGKDFIIKGELVREPDSLSLGVSFAPKVIVFLEDIEKIEVPLSESRTRYRLLLKDSSGTILTKEVREEVIAYARENRLRFDDAIDGPNNLLEGISSVDDFIGIVLAVALFLVVINIGANLTYLLARFRKTIALLKIYGVTRKKLISTFITIFGCVGFLAGSLGSLAGVLFGKQLILFIRGAYGVELVAHNGLFIVVLGGIFGLAFIIISSLPFLRLVDEVQPKELLLNTITIQESLSLRRVTLYIPIPIFLTAMLYIVSKDILIASLGVILCAVVFLFFMGIVYGILRSIYSIRNKLPFLLRSIVSFLYLRKTETLVSVSAIMVAFSLVFLVAAVQTNIQKNLRVNITTTAPALYLIDITKSQLEEVRALAGETFTEYPIVRGRLLFFNDRDLLKEDNRELRREFNLTYRDYLIEGERVTDGVLGDDFNGQVKVPVSIDKEFAEEFGGVKLGDTITLFIQGVELQATITSVREVDSRSGVPFFYLVFPKHVLEKFPASFFGTVDVEESLRQEIEKQIAARFPNIIPLVTSSLITTVTTVVENIVKVVTLVSVPSITLGLLLIVVMLTQNMYERSTDVLILRAFGMNKKKVTQLFIIEGFFLVFLSGIISYGIAHILAFVINITIFSFESFSFTLLPFWILLGNVLFVIGIAYILSFTITKTPLKKLLAEK